MGLKFIPHAYENECDGCGKKETSSSQSRPKYWSGLALYRDAYDFQGQAVADGSITRLLCGECTRQVAEAINQVIERRRTAR